MATIYDVARLAGVSPKTVSRVINGDLAVVDKTRHKVEHTIQQLGYVPSNAARMMRSSKSGLIGLITGAISKSGISAEPDGLPDLNIVQAIQKSISASGKILMIADTGGDSTRVPDLVRIFSEHRVEGLIYVADYHRQVDFDTNMLYCPVLLVNCYDDKNTPCVLPDDRTLQKNLVARLIEQGHTRIGFLTLNPQMDASQLRLQGYKDALQQGGIPYCANIVIEGYAQVKNHTYKALAKGLDTMLALDNPPTVYCCGNDEMALRLYGLLRAKGIAIPEQVSVVGFDDYRVIAETLYPALTTVALPYDKMGKQASEVLLQLIDSTAETTDKKPFQQSPILVSGEVVWRLSTKALPSA